MEDFKKLTNEVFPPSFLWNPHLKSCQERVYESVKIAPGRRRKELSPKKLSTKQGKNGYEQEKEDEEAADGGHGAYEGVDKQRHRPPVPVKCNV